MPNIFLEFQYKSSFFGDNLKLKPNCMRLQFPGPMFPDIYMVRKANNFISRYFINLTIAYLSDMRSTISKTQESYQILSNFIMLRFRSLLQKSSQSFFIGGQHYKQTTHSVWKHNRSKYITKKKEKEIHIQDNYLKPDIL